MLSILLCIRVTLTREKEMIEMLQNCGDNFKKMCLFIVFNVEKLENPLRQARGVWLFARLKRFTVRFCRARCCCTCMAYDVNGVCTTSVALRPKLAVLHFTKYIFCHDYLLLSLC